MKISEKVEQIFAHAVTLAQNGKLKNTIYALGSEVFILNMDNSVLLNFELRKTEAPFTSPISFVANDYDSRDFHEEEGKIVFTQKKDEYTRKKTCSTPGDTPEDIKKMFKGFKPLKGNVATINEKVLSLLDESLSHIEISVKDGKLKLVQRNIYSGSVIEIEEIQEGLGILSNDLKDFDPIGIRTSDFQALFTFQSSLYFGFPENGEEYIYITNVNNKRKMGGVIATCVYDELGTVTESKKVGKRKKKKG